MRQKADLDSCLPFTIPRYLQPSLTRASAWHFLSASQYNAPPLLSLRQRLTTGNFGLGSVHFLARDRSRRGQTPKIAAGSRRTPDNTQQTDGVQPVSIYRDIFNPQSGLGFSQLGQNLPLLSSKTLMMLGTKSCAFSKITIFLQGEK